MSGGRAQENFFACPLKRLFKPDLDENVDFIVEAAQMPTEY